MQRSTGELAVLLFVGIVIPLGIFAMLYKLAAPSFVVTPAPTPERRRDATTPVVITVNALVEWPTATPRQRFEAPATATSRPNFCDAGITKPGAICTMPPPIVTSTPVQNCFGDAWVLPGEQCVWNVSPTPVGVEELWK